MNVNKVPEGGLARGRTSFGGSLVLRRKTFHPLIFQSARVFIFI